MKNNPKIFIGFSEVANFYSNILKGFKKLNIEYEFFNYGENKREYNPDLSKSIIQKGFSNLSKMQFSSKNRLLRSLFYIMHILLRVPLFIYSVIKFDVFIFNYNSSFFGLYDLPILKFFNKKIIYTFHGSDSRPPYMSGNYIYEDYSLEVVYKITKNLNKKNQIIDKYADYIICGPASTQFFNRKTINFQTIGLPIDLSTIKVDTVDIKNKKATHIVHAPSTKKQKGSDIFFKIINELKEDGYSIQYDELYNLPNIEVLKRLAVCDFVLDEIYSDTTVAGLATEAAYFSKPTIVGGYYKQIGRDLNNIPIPPSLYVNPSEIKSAVVKLIEDIQFRTALGNDVKKYVSTLWTPEAVANRFLRIINDDIPQEWFFDASKSDYLYGWGVSKEDLKEFLKKYVGKFGRDGLFLSHNPTLEDKILEFIKD